MRIPLSVLLVLAACGRAPSSAPAQQPQPPAAQPQARAPIQGFRVVNTYPHDPRAFTQGLFWLDGNLYESTGQVGESTIRRVDLESGRVLQTTDIPSGQFGEGIVNWGDQIVSITWQGGIGHRWDRRTLRHLSEWSYPGEGWGLTQNGRDIIMSDGTAELRFLDPETLQERRRVTVTLNGRPVTQLNELEWVRGEVFANVWMQPAIIRIDPASGNVTGIVDLTSLAQQNGGPRDDVLNGIAWDPATDRLFVTGKYWSRLYEIELAPPPGP